MITIRQSWKFIDIHHHDPFLLKILSSLVWNVEKKIALKITSVNLGILCHLSLEMFARILSRTLSLPRVINIKFPLQPHQKYNITQYEEVGFSMLILIWNMIILAILSTSLLQFSSKGWKNVLLELMGVRGLITAAFDVHYYNTLLLHQGPVAAFLTLPWEGNRARKGGQRSTSKRQRRRLKMLILWWRTRAQRKKTRRPRMEASRRKKEAGVLARCPWAQPIAEMNPTR